MSAINRTLAALRRLKDEGLVLLRADAAAGAVAPRRDGQAWLEHTDDVADPGRVRYGAGMVDYGN